jgi:hypothetical protein
MVGEGSRRNERMWEMSGLPVRMPDTYHYRSVNQAQLAKQLRYQKAKLHGAIHNATEVFFFFEPE